MPVDGTNEKKTATTFDRWGGGLRLDRFSPRFRIALPQRSSLVVEHPSSADQSLGYIPCPCLAGGFVGTGKKTVTFVRETLPSVRGRYSRDTRQTCGGVHDRSAIRVTRETVCVYVYIYTIKTARVESPGDDGLYASLAHVTGRTATTHHNGARYLLWKRARREIWKSSRKRRDRTPPLPHDPGTRHRHGGVGKRNISG